MSFFKVTLFMLTCMALNVLHGDIIIQNNAKIKGQSSGNGLLYDPNADGIDEIKIDVGGNLMIGGNYLEGGATARGGLHVDGDAKFTGNVYVGGATLDDGLVGWWTFDEEDSSGNIIDHSGQGHHGALNSFTFSGNSQTGIFGKALDFDGVDDKVNVNPDIFTTERGSVSFWFNTSHDFSTSGFMVYFAESALGDGFGGAAECHIGLNSAEQIEVHFNGSTAGVSHIWLGSSAAYNDGEWHHVCVAWDIGDNLTLYIDGAYEGSQVHTGINYNSAGGVVFGHATSGTRIYKGLLDEIRFYNRALNTKEVAELYRAKSSYFGQGGTMSGNVAIAGNAVIEDVLHFETLASAPSSPSAGEMYSDGANLFFYDGSVWKDTTLGGNVKWPVASSNIGNSGSIAGDNLVGWWTLDESTGNTATDSSSQGNDGTLTNMSFTTNSVSGKINQALDFEESDSDRISISHTPYTSLTTGAVAGWFKREVTGVRQAIFALNDESDSDRFVVECTASDNLQCIIRNATVNHVQILSPSGLVNNTDWHHFVVMNNGTDVKMYINGSLVNTTGTNANKWFNDVNTLDAGYIGYDNKSTGAIKWDGYLDDIRIYNRALSATEIQSLYSATYQTHIGSTSTPEATLEIDNSSGTNDILSARDNGTEVLVIKDGGNVGLGTSSPTHKLHVAGNVNISTDLILSGNLSLTGNIYLSTTHSYELGSTSLAFNSITSQSMTITSDRRLKGGIKEINYGLKEILQLRPKRYHFKHNLQTEQIGLIAQEVKEIIPEVVRDGDTLGVRYFDLVPVLIKSQQENRAAMRKELIELLQLLKKEEEINQQLKLKLKELK